MAKENCLIVQAAGKQLDLLRGEASRIAKGSKIDWWIDRADAGTRFCFEDAKAKAPPLRYHQRSTSSRPGVPPARPICCWGPWFTRPPSTYDTHAPV